MLHPLSQFFFGAFPAFCSKLFCGPPFFALPRPLRAQKGVSCGHSFWAEKKAARRKRLSAPIGAKKAKSQKPEAGSFLRQETGLRTQECCFQFFSFFSFFRFRLKMYHVLIYQKPEAKNCCLKKNIHTPDYCYFCLKPFQRDSGSS